jgi:cytochrome c peroxidase
MPRLSRLAFSSIVALLYLFSFGSAKVADPQPLAPAIPQSALQPHFIPPPPGTYALPPIDSVTDHSLLDSGGQPVRLADLAAGKIAVVSFMYTSCADVGGCPLAAAVLQQVDQALAHRPEVAKQVTLLSISFDPERDTPMHLAEIRRAVAPRTNWHFLTAATPQQLQPVLADFNQPVAKLRKEDGNWSGLFRHVLKVYLLDQDRNVRNIYSTGFLSAQLVVNDIETVLLENKNRAATSRQP